MSEILYFNGSVLTMDKNIPRAEALLTDGRSIKAVGSLAELRAVACNADEYDLCGKTLMPAFVDGHSHVMMQGSMLNKCDLSGCRSFDEILETILAYREKNRLFGDEKISCYGYDLSLLKEGRHPTKEVLDRLGIDNPVGCTHASFHMGVYNSAALKGAGIDDSYTFSGSGIVGRDQNGHLNGYFEEGARKVMSEFMSRGISESFEDNYRLAEELYLKHGITTIQDGGNVKEEKIKKFARLAEDGKITADIILYLEPRLKDPGFWERAKNLLAEYDHGGKVRIGGVKMVLDGSPQAKTAWMSKPYEGNPEYCGYPNLTDECVYEVLRRAADAGMQVLAHCNGDAAAEQYLSAWEKVVSETPDAVKIRPVMIHAQTVRYDQLERMANVGMIPSFFIGHCYYWGDTHLYNLGDERGRRISPARAALELGMKINFHQDSPVTPPDMLHSIWCAVNRLTRSGRIIGEENRIDVYDALIAATNGAAYSYFEENTRGIIKPGAVADLIILSEDPTASHPEHIKDIKITAVIKEGKRVRDYS